MAWAYEDKRTCTIGGCDKPHVARGYCGAHYYKWRTYGDPLAFKNRSPNFVVDGVKHCPLCDTDKWVEEFTKMGDGYHAWCNDCRNEKRRADYAENPTPHQISARKAQIKFKYGISADEYRVRFDEQGGACGICRRPATGAWALCVDHDHKCCDGERCCGNCVRGLICTACNSVLGLARDDPQTLQNAILYLGGTQPWL